MPSFQHQGATIYYEEFGRGFPILTFAPAGLQSTIEVWSKPMAPINPPTFIPEWKTGAALTSARARVQEFLAKHTPRA